MSNNKFAAAAAAAAAVNDMTQAVKGGDFAPPAAGPCRLRFVGYVETGKQVGKGFTGERTEKPQALWYFEVSGPKHPVREHEGRKFPAYVLEVKTDISRNESAKYYKLMQLLNWQAKAKHPAELLGDGFKGELLHRKYAKAGEDKADPTKWTGVAVEVWEKATKTFKISPPRTLDEETAEYMPITVAEALTPQKCFLWDFADMEQWASIFIEGEYAAEEAKDGKPAKAARSKNVIQAKIKQALNFVGSPIHTLLLNNGQPIDIPAADSTEDDVPEDDGAPAAPAASMPDPLAG